MVTEIYAGLAAMKAAFDIAKGLKEIDDRTRLNAAIIELQDQILSAQHAQTESIERVRGLEAELAEFQTWEAEKQKYALQQLGMNGVYAYAIRESHRGDEPPHFVCPDCYEDRHKSILQQEIRMPGRCDVRFCQRCGWESYVSGVRHPEHGRPSPRRR